MSQVQKLLEAD